MVFHASQAEGILLCDSVPEMHVFGLPSIGVYGQRGLVQIMHILPKPESSLCAKSLHDDSA